MQKRYLSFAAIAALCALGACSKKAETQEEAAAKPETAEAASASLEDAVDAVQQLATVDPDAPPADGTERFFGREKFTIVSAQTGAQTGDVTEHVRDWGRQRAEVTHSTVSISGYTQAMNQKTVQNGDKIATVNLDTGAVTTMDNPMYDTIVAKMKGKSGLDFGKEIMTEMGGSATGEQGSFAGHDCEYWELPSVGAKTCVTAWGGTLHTNVSMGGMTFERKATEVRLGDGGPDDAFAYDASKATTAPNIGDIMKQAQEAAEAMKQPN